MGGFDLSVSYTVNIKDGATPELRAQIAKCDPRRLGSFVAPAVAKKVKANFLARPHNQRGWHPVNFWADAARATNYQILPDGVLISVNKIGVRQRYQGGPIRPLNAKALAIPVAEEAYGKVPADFGDQLQLIIIKGKGAWLALKSYEQRPQDRQHGLHQQQGPGLSTVRERLKFLFLLIAGVDQKADPAVLPPDEEILSTARTAALEAIK
jgi:hypothetical protein